MQPRLNTKSHDSKYTESLVATIFYAVLYRGCSLDGTAINGGNYLER